MTTQTRTHSIIALRQRFEEISRFPSFTIQSADLEEITASLRRIEAEDAPIRAALDNLLRHHNAGSVHDTVDCEFAKQAVKALTATPAPAKHMRQSGNGCVTCPRRWSEHTPEERGEPASLDLEHHVEGNEGYCSCGQFFASVSALHFHVTDNARAATENK